MKNIQLLETTIQRYQEEIYLFLMVESFDIKTMERFYIQESSWGKLNGNLELFRTVLSF